MEVIFEIIAKNKEILYVIDKNHKQVGVLDRYGIIDKILMRRQIVMIASIF